MFAHLGYVQCYVFDDDLAEWVAAHGGEHDFWISSAN